MSDGMSLPAPSSSRAEGAAARHRRAEPRGRFDEVLARARRPASARDEPAGGVPHAAPRVPARSPSRAAPDARRGNEAELGAAAPSVVPAMKLATPPGIPELQAALRSAPAAIAAALREGQPQLALSFGSALSIDLRVGAQGLELSLRPSASLEGAARAELPRLLDALRARGLRVARAEVRARPAAPAPSRAR
jgi:hypothetical protein